MHNTDSSAAAISSQGDGNVVVSGVLDFKNVPMLAKQASSLFSFNQDLTIDLSQVSQINSAGLALLLSWRVEAESAGKHIQFNGAPEQLKQLVKINQLNEMLAI